MCISVNNDTGEAIAPMLHAGMQKFAPQNRNSSHKAITLMEQGSSMKEGKILIAGLRFSVSLHS